MNFYQAMNLRRPWQALVSLRSRCLRLMEEHKDIVRLLKAGYSIRKTAKLATHKDGSRKGKPKGASTVQRVAAAMKEAGAGN